MAFGSFSTPSVNTKNIAGYRPPEKLFAGLPTGPGMVTPETTVSMPIEGMDIQDQAAAYALQQKMKADRKAEWAKAAAINRMRQAAGKVYGGGGHYLPPTQAQTQSEYYNKAHPEMRGLKLGGGNFQGEVKYAPQGFPSGSAAFGTWADREQKAAMAENRPPPLLLSRYSNEPYGPEQIGRVGMPTWTKRPGRA